MRKNINKAHLEGKVFSAELEIAEVKNKESSAFGQKYIKGTVNIAIDEEGLNVIPVTYSFVTPTFAKSGKPNLTYKFLETLINKPELTWEKGGAENAIPVVVDTSINLCEYYNQDQATKELNLVSFPRLEGGFISKAKEPFSEDMESRNVIEADMLITATNIVEANEEKETPEYMTIKGCIFNFQNKILPMSFKVTNPMGINYFNSLSISNEEPLYTKIYGTINNTTVVTSKTIETAFGGPRVQKSNTTHRDWILTSMIETPYNFGDENVLTVEDVTKAVQTREVDLAELKSRREKYEAEKKTGAAPAGFPTASAPATSPTGWKF